MEATKLSAEADGIQDPRKRVAGLLAKALPEELAVAWERLEPKPSWRALRGPETGLVMVRGRIGGGGAPFNLGEATVSRATVMLGSGTVGHAHALGTDREKARLSAIFDAVWQEPDSQHFVETELLGPIAERLDAENRRLAEETAATKVEFFTMVRGEDA